MTRLGIKWRFRRAAFLHWLGKVEPAPPGWFKNLVDAGKTELTENKSNR